MCYQGTFIVYLSIAITSFRMLCSIVPLLRESFELIRPAIRIALHIRCMPHVYALKTVRSIEIYGYIVREDAFTPSIECTAFLMIRSLLMRH